MSKKKSTFKTTTKTTTKTVHKLENNMMYFAYGSNMNVDQMARRCPGAEIIGTAKLPAHHLVFKGVADCVPGGKYIDGVVWNINIQHLYTLDRYEGYPHLYDSRSASVILESGYQISAMFYYMVHGFITAPVPAYYKSILDGYNYFDIDPTPLRAAARAAMKEDAWYKNLYSTSKK